MNELDNFDFHLSTRIHFGKGSTACLKEEVLQYGKKVFFVYDAGPVKGSGLYDQVVKVLTDNGIAFTEFTGVEPNPRHTTVNRGVAALREFGADCIVAAGGGSTLDCAKAISFGVYHDGDVWDFYCGKVQIQKTMPVIAIPTLAAAGAEVSFSAVVSNLETKQKIGLRNPKNRPVCAILDPTFTFSVPKYHTACGVVDIMSHTYESYIGPDNLVLQDGIAEAIQRACIESGRKVMADPCDYDARAALLWASDLSISALGSLGRSCFTAPVHTMEHILSAYYDIVHGAGIAIVSLAWFKYCLTPENTPIFAKWGRNVWGLKDAATDYDTGLAAIAAFEDFCKELGLPTRLGDVNITRENIQEIADNEIGRLAGANTWLRPITTREQLFEVYALAL